MRNETIQGGGPCQAGAGLTGRTLGILVSVGPGHPNFTHAVRLAATALGRGVRVYLYCIDEAVRAVGHEPMEGLQREGLTLYACAYAAHRRDLALSESATFAGLGVVSDLISGTERFVSFN